MTQPASYTFPFERERESESHHEIFQQLSSPRSLFHVAAKKKKKMQRDAFWRKRVRHAEVFRTAKILRSKNGDSFDILPKYLQICKT